VSVAQLVEDRAQKERQMSQFLENYKTLVAEQAEEIRRKRQENALRNLKEQSAKLVRSIYEMEGQEIRGSDLSMLLLDIRSLMNHIDIETIPPIYKFPNLLKKQVLYFFEELDLTCKAKRERYFSFKLTQEIHSALFDVYEEVQ
jgi:hypothetical protein